MAWLSWSRAVQVYAGRFEFLRGLLDGEIDGPAVLRGPLASSRFYVLRPTWIRLIDNSAGLWPQRGVAPLNDTAIFERQHSEQAALRGVPSLVWRAGQERRMGLIRQWAPLDGAHALVDGCGVGMYVRGLQGQGAEVWGLDVEHEHVARGRGQRAGRGPVPGGRRGAALPGRARLIWC